MVISLISSRFLVVLDGELSIDVNTDRQILTVGDDPKQEQTQQISPLRADSPCPIGCSPTQRSSTGSSARW